jgi:hypothetical protein
MLLPARVFSHPRLQCHLPLQNVLIKGSAKIDLQVATGLQMRATSQVMISGQNLKQLQTLAFMSFCAASLRFPETRTILRSAWSGLLRKTLSQFMQDRTNTVPQTMAISYIKLIAWVVGNVLQVSRIAPSK